MSRFPSPLTVTKTHTHTHAYNGHEMMRELCHTCIMVLFCTGNMWRAEQVIIYSHSLISSTRLLYNLHIQLPHIATWLAYIMLRKYYVCKCEKIFWTT